MTDANASIEVVGARLRREVLRARRGGLTRGELAVLLLDIDDDLVGVALGREIAAGSVVASGWAVAPVRYYPAPDPATEPGATLFHAFDEEVEKS